VLDETMGHPVTNRGWIASPMLNRLVCFKGTQLHCVLPGAGVSPTPDARRTTFMVAFWLDDPRAPQTPFPSLSIATTTEPLKKKTKMIATTGQRRRRLSALSPGSNDSMPLWPSLITRPFPSHSPPSPLQPALNPLAIYVVDRVIDHITQQRESGNRKKKRRNDEESDVVYVATAPISGVSLLNDDVFCHFDALSNGLVLAKTSVCSLNCGGTCPMCLSANQQVEE
jgi:hypothetical protein